jgi:hypothetical protein
MDITNKLGSFMSLSVISICKHNWMVREEVQDFSCKSWGPTFSSDIVILDMAPAEQMC